MKKVLLLFALLVGAISASAVTMGDTYTKVTSADDLTLGDEYIICYNNIAMGSINGKYFSAIQDGVNVIDNVATIMQTNLQAVKIVNGTKEGKYAFELVNGSSTNIQYITCTGTSNASLTLSETKGENADWEITILTDNSAQIAPNNSTSGSNLFQYNTSSPRFANYIKSGQKNTTLYKKDNTPSKTQVVLTWNPQEITQEVGMPLPKITLSAKVDGVENAEALAAVEYHSDNTDLIQISENGEVSITEGATGNVTLTASIPTSNATYSAIAAKLSIYITRAGNLNTIKDELTITSFGVTGTSYTEASYTSNITKICYKGQMAGGNSSIQLRSNNNNSGIVINTNPNGLILTQIIVEWNSSTTNGRTINFYGSDNAFEIGDMYSSTSAPTEIGTLTKGTSIFEPKGDYKYIGLRSNSGAMYLSKITLVWAKINYAEATIYSEPVEYIKEGKIVGNANLLTLKTPVIIINGNTIDIEQKKEFTIYRDQTQLGNAFEDIPGIYFENGADNNFTISNGVIELPLNLTGATLDSEAEIQGAEYIVEADGVTTHVAFYVAPKNNNGLDFLVKSDDADVFWRSHETYTGAACHFYNVHETAAPATFTAYISYPIAVLKAAAPAGIKLMAEGDAIESPYDFVEYDAAPTTLSTTEDRLQQNEGNTSGVADVAVDQEGEAEFFNLQGVRVQGELAPGLYIRRQGNTAVKVMIK